MKLYYASRTGNVQKLIDRMGIEASKIIDGNEIASEDFVVITYTDGEGIIPPNVKKFLDQNRDKLKGAAVSGNSERHPDTFCTAADKIEAEYGCPIIVRFEKDGEGLADQAIIAALS